MKNKQRRKFIIELALRTTVIFTVGITLLSLTGFIFSRLATDGKDVPEMFNYSNAGLPYSYILLFVCIALVIAFFSIFFEELFSKNPESSKYERLFKKYKFDKKKPLT